MAQATKRSRPMAMIPIAPGFEYRKRRKVFMVYSELQVDAYHSRPARNTRKMFTAMIWSDNAATYNSTRLT